MLVMEHQVESFQLPNSCPVFWALQVSVPLSVFSWGFVHFFGSGYSWGLRDPPPSSAVGALGALGASRAAGAPCADAPWPWGGVTG